MQSSIPVCFYPTRKIIIDDDHAFTDSMLLKMHHHNLSSYNSPIDALNYLSEEYKPVFAKFDIIKESSSAQHVIDINIEKLQSMVSTPRYQDISVILIDYHMPDIQGIDFLKKIQHLPIKYVLITAEQDYNIAIDAFNAGLVDAYIRKDDPDFTNKIQRMTHELEWKYFTELSDICTNISDFDFLKNPNLLSTFKTILEDNKITEFYLNHTHGNFTMINKDQKEMHLLVRTQAQLEILSTIAEEDGGSPQIIDDLKSGKVIPFFGAKEYWQVPASEWDKFAYPAIKVKGDAGLLWSIVNDT